LVVLELMTQWLIKFNQLLMGLMHYSIFYVNFVNLVIVTTNRKDLIDEALLR
jgi:hypothetical protein